MAKILMVDDSRTSRKLLRSILEEGGHEVIGEAVNGQEGVKQFQALKPEIVTMDITMPVLDGIEALKMIKALAAPYVGLNFMPTGGISAANVRDYLAYDRIVACGGSWMVSGKLVKEGRFDEIEGLVREAADIVKEIRG